MNTGYDLSCDCGAVHLSVRGSPLASGYCHCESCRRLFGVEVLLASWWHGALVERRVSSAAELTGYRLPGRDMWRYHCSRCGRLMHGRNRHDYIVIPNERFRVACEGLPLELYPSAHFFYDQRVVDIDDDLPRKADGVAYPDIHDPWETLE